MIFTNAKQCHTHKAIHDDISCYWEGGKTQVSFTSISRNYMYSQKKPITLFYEYLKISFTLYLHVPEH